MSLSDNIRGTWTTKKPTKPGYYWAMFKLKEKAPYPIMLEYCEYDLYGVTKPKKRIKEYRTMFSSIDINLFSHFMGPLKIPNAPIDCAVISATGIDKDGNVFEVKKRICDDKWSIVS